MKVLMILDREFPPDLRVENEIEALTKQGIEVHLACFTRKNLPSREVRDKLIIHRQPISDLTYKSSVAALTFPRYFRFWRHFLQKLVYNDRFDIIHVHDLPLVAVGVELKKNLHIPLIADLHENWPAYLRMAQHTRTVTGRVLSPNKMWIRYEKSILQDTDHIIVVVDEAKQRLSSIGLDPEKITIVSNTLNIAHAHIPVHTEEHKIPVLFYAGGINYHRGLQTVIKAMAKTRQKKYKLLALGEGRYKNNLIDLARSLGLQDFVNFPGWVPYQEMLQQMNKSDYALIPHIKSDHTDSTIPHKLFQYMYAGIPVIASNCIPIERIVKETRAGIIFPSEDSERLAEILDSLNEEQKEEMGKNGRYWVEEKYNWQHDAEDLVKVYKTLTDKSRT